VLVSVVVFLKCDRSKSQAGPKCTDFPYSVCLVQIGPELY
jgi:hypothetical protein